MSSVSVGVDANLLVASRELNTVWSLAHDGSGVQWTLSASLGERDDGSSIAFERDADMFYSPHDAKQLANGNVLVGLTQVVPSRAWNPQASMLVFEVDARGDAVAHMSVPRPTQTSGVAFGGYRTLPWASVGGESETDPFDSSRR